MRGRLRVQPSQQSDELLLGHGGATRAGGVWAAPHMKENGAAIACGGRLLIVTDLQHPAVGCIAKAHALFFKPWRDAASRIDAHMAVIIRTGGIIHIGIPGPHLQIRPACAGRWRGRVAKKAAKLKNACRGPAILLDLQRNTILGNGEDATTPCQTFFTQ